MLQTSKVTRQATQHEPMAISEIGERLDQIMPLLLRGSMVVIMLWFGLLKFTVYEAEAIHGLVANSPFMSWLTLFLSKTSVSYLIGILEITTGLLIAGHMISPRIGAIGGAMATCVFLITLSFFFSTPGVSEASAGGFPVISVLPGQFLLKDLVLLCVSLWILGAGLKHWNA